MDKSELAKKLDDALESFVNETKHFDSYGKNPVSEGDLKEVIKQVFCTMDAFKDAILNYLD